MKHALKKITFIFIVSVLITGQIFWMPLPAFAEEPVQVMGMLDWGSIRPVSESEPDADIDPLEASPLDITDGWDLAASNDNYAFKVSEVTGAAGKTEYVLQLLKIETGEIRDLVQVTDPDYLSSVYDVSRDGSTIVYAYMTVETVTAGNYKISFLQEGKSFDLTVSSGGASSFQEILILSLVFSYKHTAIIKFQDRGGRIREITVNLEDFENSITTIEPIEPSLGLEPEDMKPFPENYEGVSIPSGYVWGSPGTSATILNSNDEAIVLEYHGKSHNSQVVLYLNYDDPMTDNIESVNLFEECPYGIIVGLAGLETENVFFEVTDADFYTSVVYLTAIDDKLRIFKVPFENFTGVDATRIQYMDFYVESEGKDIFQLAWGSEDGSMPETFTLVDKIPPLSDGNLTSMGKFADEALVEVEKASDSEFSIHYEGHDQYAFGGIFFNYDLPETTGIETANFQELYPDGFSFWVKSEDTYEIFLRFKDFKDDAIFISPGVRLIDLPSEWGRYTISPDDLDPYLDLTSLLEVTFVFEGEVSGTVDIIWGDFRYEELIEPASAEIATTPLLPLENGELPSFLLFDDGAGSFASVNIQSQENAELIYTGLHDDSYGGAYLNYDLAETNLVEIVNFLETYPNGIVFSASSSNTDEVLFEVKDDQRRISQVRITDLGSQMQAYRIGLHKFSGVDLARIQIVSFVFTGADRQRLDLEWGPFSYTPVE